MERDERDLTMPSDPRERQAQLDEDLWTIYEQAAAFVKRRMEQEGLKAEDASILMDMFLKISDAAWQANQRIIESASAT